MGLYEWTMNKVSGSDNKVYCISDKVLIEEYPVYIAGAGIRPLFVLKNNIVLLSGKGTYDDPYRITE